MAPLDGNIQYPQHRIRPATIETLNGRLIESAAQVIFAYIALDKLKTDDLGTLIEATDLRTPVALKVTDVASIADGDLDSVFALYQQERKTTISLDRISTTAGFSFPQGWQAYASDRIRLLNDDIVNYFSQPMLSRELQIQEVPAEYAHVEGAQALVAGKFIKKHGTSRRSKSNQIPPDQRASSRYTLNLDEVDGYKKTTLEGVDAINYSTIKTIAAVGVFGWDSTIGEVTRIKSFIPSKVNASMRPHLEYLGKLTHLDERIIKYGTHVLDAFAEANAPSPGYRMVNQQVGKFA